MEKSENVIRRLFQENNRGKISVQLAHAKIEEVAPSLSMRRRGQLLKKCFSGLKRGKPGPSKGNPCRQWMYYGIELKASNDHEGGKSMDGICLPSDWGKGHANTPPLLNGLDNILRNVAIDTPPEVSELRKRVESLEKELAAQKKKDAESTMIRRYAGRLPPSMLLTGELLPSGKYVGAGTYGNCEISKYKEVPVVVKKFKNPDKLSQLRIRDSVIEEAMSILNLQPHRNLPQLVGVCIGQMPYSLVTQYWGDREDESLTIFRVLRSKRLLGTVPWVKVIQEVMDGLAAIHRSGIVHNDIKEDNIVLRRGLEYSPQIIDFGKATPLRATQSHAKRVSVLSVKEQLQKRRRYPWIAPELVSGKETPSEQTDVYSLGYVVNCITRRRPITILKNVEALAYVDECAKRASLKYILQTLNDRSNN